MNEGLQFHDSISSHAFLFPLPEKCTWYTRFLLPGNAGVTPCMWGLGSSPWLPGHPLLLTSPFAFSLSQHQGRFQWVGSLHQVAKELELQHHSFQWIFKVDFLSFDLTLVWPPCSLKDSSRVLTSTTVWNCQFFLAQSSFGPTFTSIHDYWKNHGSDYTDLCRQSDVSVFLLCCLGWGTKTPLCHGATKPLHYS